MILLTIYLTGYILSYILMRWLLRKQEYYNYEWSDITLNSIVSMLSWVMVISILVFLIANRIVKTKNKVPKWL